ncbi:ABC transporter substrate-binding protein [Alteromonas aestuariivivens]|uniref:ABC transporter substrate-binding protein n=1 Tax=Alteromonas aestuariivivens TaxID=1938339 RepID=A0A3D8M9L3_9ALTE|nr:ABC transporter substrate-binding protein [Alteromonas aestuariivivens]RDV26666.1 ABC transporter substrate-binding protein [Alteromonas aestuariivivens]
MKLGCILFALSFSLVSAAFAKPLRIPDSSSADKLPITLIKEFVARSDQFDSVTFIYGSSGDVAFSKTVADLENRALDVLWTATTTDYENNMQAIYIPIYRGLLGMRIPIVEQSNLNLFRDVKQFDALKKFIPCQGKLWADTKVLEANQILVAKSVKYPNLFDMLEGERCEYFPRAVFEPWAEIERMSHFNLAVEPNILLRYTMPMFFFVHKKDAALARHMNSVFGDMVEDGTFNRLFFADGQVKSALAKSKLGQRRLFELDNPYLSKSVQNIPKHYWFDLLKEQ